MEEQESKKILDKVSQIENVLRNLIFNITHINDWVNETGHAKNLINLLSIPLNVDDRRFAESLNEFKKTVSNLENIKEKIDVLQHLGEIKYIGNRLNEMEKIIKNVFEILSDLKINNHIYVGGKQIYPPIDLYNESEVEKKLKFLNMNLENTNLPWNIISRLRSRGFHTVSDLSQMEIKNLIKMGGIGKQSIFHIQKFLESNGLTK